MTINQNVAWYFHIIYILSVCTGYTGMYTSVSYIYVCSSQFDIIVKQIKKNLASGIPTGETEYFLFLFFSIHKKSI